jgi:hypothetical protein
MKSRHVVVAVECDLPPGVTQAQFKQHVVDNVQAGCGCLHPDDPLFHLDRKTVRATIIPHSTEWLRRHFSDGMSSRIFHRWFA